MSAQLGFLSRSARRALVGLSAAVLLAFSCHSAFAALVINLRFNDTGTGGTSIMDISSLSPGNTVTIQVWATVSGANTTTTDDGMNSSFFGMTSGPALTANLTGNITTGSPFAPFSFAAADGGQIGTFGDRNADTIGDWRGTALTSSSGWAKAGHGTSQVLSGGSDGHANLADPTHSWDFHIADAIFTVGSITLPSGTQNVLTYNASVLGNLGLTNSGKASWFEDGVSKSGAATLPSAGTGVTFTLTGAAGNPDIDPTPTSLPFAALLLNAQLPPSQNVTLTNNGTQPGSYSTSTTGVAVVTSGATGGPIAPNGNLPMGVGLAAGTTTTYGINKPGTVVVSTTGDPDSAATDTVNVSVTVGEANTTGPTFAGALILTGNVAATSGTYTGLASRTTAGGGNVGTEARMLAGTNSTGGPELVSMQWRQRTVNEKGVVDGGTPTSPPLPASTGGDPSILISDVVSLTGLAAADTSQNSPGHTKTDVYVLQMTYDENKLTGGAGTEAAKQAAASIYLAWLDPNGAGPGVPEWTNAVNGNFANAGGAVFNFLGDYASAGSPTTVGSWGVDTTNNLVWAVLDHASEFSVVPEPASIALLGIGTIGLLVGLRRRRR